MKTLRLTAPATLQICEEPIPAPSGNETLIRVKAVGICGSDLLWFSEAGIGDARLMRPLILGHEFMGVTPSGQRVAVDPAIPCRKCEFCQRGHPNLCANMRFAGHGEQDGALREWMAWDNDSLFPIPDTLSDAAGVLLEPLGVAIHAVDLAHLKTGMTVGVFGCGPIGLLIIRLARLAGAGYIYASDPRPHRLATAREFGADQTWQDEGPKAGAELLGQTGGRGVDVAFEAAGAQAAVDCAFACCVAGGKVILAGIPDDDSVSFSASLARRKGLTIKLVRRMKHTYPRAIDLVSRRQVNVDALVSHHFPLAESSQAFTLAARREGLKVIIDL